MKIAVIGSNMVDLVTYVNDMPKWGETLEAPSFSIGCGGKGANQAIAAAKLGADVMMISKVGDDLFADNTIANFSNFGVNNKYVKKVTGCSSGVAPIFVDQSAQNQILIIKGANNFLVSTDIDEAETDLKNCDVIVLQLEIPLNTVYYAIDFANKYNIPVILNPAPATTDLNIEYACRCDFFMPNESELAILTNLPVSTLEEIEYAANVLLQKGLKNIVVTLGSRGALWMTKDTKIHIPPTKVDAIDSSGAGDAFIGCFSHYLVKSGDVLTALKQASIFAAYSVTGRGTQSSYPDIEQFENFKTSHNL
ncbi:ribokinase [Ursidibacter maritimus]|uniref:Deoxyribokinase n=1 Tax=Ursidibacter maritimus TaxID=1331689 RepID=A0A949T8R1_9PAST|nr:ribokinase [Ursidibacter maritimus]KAE9541482.1 ribokinase [Ursidibacter maritimus]MBV6524838.1 ribokinase [Ursidibacter maritimus]MBV6526745.1 ribokinase [Ursidibacter maritimus]MBV6528596.1 ribokinase [Ursidibacter maritimus]MBV6530441.1 ribokinase [Ursidibacter maritimus]